MTNKDYSCKRCINKNGDMCYLYDKDCATSLSLCKSDEYYLSENSIGDVINNHSEYKKLIEEIYSKVYPEEITQVVNYGATIGVGSFIYYTDTHKFCIDNRNDILSLLKIKAKEENENCLFDYIKSKIDIIDEDSCKDLMKYILGYDVDQCITTNNISWLILEEICSWFVK